MTLIFPKKSVPALCWYHVTKELLYTFCVQGTRYTRWKVATLFVKYLLHFTSKLSHFTFGITFCRDNSIALLHLYYYILRQNIINNNAGSFTSTIAPQLTAIYFLSRRTVQTLTFVWTSLQRATAKKRRHPTAKITSLQAQSRESPYSCVILHLYRPINDRLSTTVSFSCSQNSLCEEVRLYL